jgi:hypothetical protein
MTSPSTEQEVEARVPVPSAEARADAPEPTRRRRLTPLRDLIAFCRQNPRWTVLMSVLILVWTTELFVVQQLTLDSLNQRPRFLFVASKIRFVLDLLFIGGLCIALGRRALYAMLVASYFAYLGLLTYFEYFERPISLLTILNQWSEALTVGDAALGIFPRGAALLLLATLAIKVTALAMSRKVSLPRPTAWAAGAVVLAGYVVLYGATVYVDPLHLIKTTQGVGRIGYIRGYLGPWFAEWYYLNDDELLRRAIERRQEPCDAISPVEADIPIHARLAIVQLESLDTNILDYRVDGVEVTPFLNQLKNRSMYYRVKANHEFGSSDADFAMLNGVFSSPDCNTYVLATYPYENTTPQLLAQCGYKTLAFHGNNGAFHGRRPPFEKLGFDAIYFREEFNREYDLVESGLGVMDHDLFRISAEKMDEADGPICHFLITLTTHTPFTSLRPEQQELYPQPKSAFERYINNMRYLDNCVRDYVALLGSDTTLVLYADHPTDPSMGFPADRDAQSGEEYVPWMIYDTDQDLSQLQTTRNDPRSTDGTWHFVDMVNYVRGQIKRSHGEPAKKDAATQAVPQEVLAN